MEEIAALKILDETLSKVQDKNARNRILLWAWKKYSTEVMPDGIESKEIEKRKRKKKQTTKKKGSKSKTKTERPSIVKELNLHPKNKQPFKEFFEEKKPNVGAQTYAVCVYYLDKELGINNIDVNHVYTCLKAIGRKLPKDIGHAMALVASRKGFIDTSDSSNIRITIAGENLIEHDLPKKAKSKK